LKVIWRSKAINAIIRNQNQRNRWAIDEYGVDMVISLNFSDGTEKILSEQAALRGQSIEDYAAELIRKGVTTGKTFAEILAPFRKLVAESGISDPELDDLFETARNEVHEAKQGQR
jgi:plasmid stability protein